MKDALVTWGPLVLPWVVLVAVVWLFFHEYNGTAVAIIGWFLYSDVHKDLEKAKDRIRELELWLQYKGCDTPPSKWLGR